MTEPAILEKIETLNQAVARLQQRVEDLEDCVIWSQPLRKMPASH
jgi:hypothetical protein